MRRRTLDAGVREVDYTLAMWDLLGIDRQKNFDHFFNMSLFVSLNMQDIKILSNNLVLSSLRQEKNLYGRMLSMVLFEFLFDINHLLGKELREELRQNQMYDSLVQIGEINKRFSNIKEEHREFLKLIRINASAHKTKNSRELIEFIKQDDFSELHAINSAVLEVCFDLLDVTTSIVELIPKNVNNLS